MGPVAAVQLFVFTDFVHRMQSGESALLALGYLSLLGIVGTGLALILFNKLIKIATPPFCQFRYISHPRGGCVLGHC
jgi:drug/metabolite transporter (DMT)-like permease